MGRAFHHEPAGVEGKPGRRRTPFPAPDGDWREQAGSRQRGGAGSRSREIARGEPSIVLPQLARGGSAGGVWPKALVLTYADGTLKVGAPDGEGMPSLLKFDLSEHGESARSEYAYSLMAEAAGIRTTRTALISESPGSKSRHLLVARFDIPENGPPERRIHFHSASGLLHQAPDALDYRDLFRIAIRLHVDHAELEELTRRMLFNVLASNHDDHGKNHAFQLDEETGRWSLTPAYDLTYSEGYLQRGTQVAGEIWPKLSTIEALCLSAGLKKDAFSSIVSAVRTALQRWPDWAGQAELSTARREEIAQRFRRIDAEVCD